MIDWLRRAPLEPQVELGGRTVPIVLRRMRHARRLTLRLAPDGSEVRITLPAWAEAREAIAFAHARADWLAGRVDYCVWALRIDDPAVLDRMATSTPPYQTKNVATPQQVAESRSYVNQIYIDPAVREYIVDLIRATRFPAKVDGGLKHLIRAGASPRGTINLALTARARAFTAGRAFVTPQDVKDMAHDVLRHRILLSYEAEAEEVNTDQILDRILAKVPVP